MSKKKDYFYNGSYKSFSGLRAQEVKSQANGLYTIMFSMVKLFQMFAEKVCLQERK